LSDLKIFSGKRPISTKTEKLGCADPENARRKTQSSCPISKKIGKNCPIAKKLRKNDNLKNETRMGTDANRTGTKLCPNSENITKTLSALDLKKKGRNRPVSKKIKNDMGPIFQKVTKIRTDFNRNGTIMCPNSVKENVRL